MGLMRKLKLLWCETIHRRKFLKITKEYKTGDQIRECCRCGIRYLYAAW